jgi:hypothetical protein
MASTVARAAGFAREAAAPSGSQTTPLDGRRVKRLQSGHKVPLRIATEVQP